MIVRVLEVDADAIVVVAPVAKDDDAVAAGCDLLARQFEGVVDDVLDRAPVVEAFQRAGVDQDEVGLRVGGAPDEVVGGGQFGLDVGAGGEGAVWMGRQG